MSGKGTKDADMVDIQIDANVDEKDGDFTNPEIDPHFDTNQDPTPDYNLYIPPRTSGGKRKKRKNRQQRTETIWTIVSEQETHQQQHQKGKERKERSSTLTSSSSKELTESQKNYTPSKKKTEKLKTKKKTIEVDEILQKSAFLSNPIFQTDLRSWSLPRVELWCKDPRCQVNIQLWKEYCQTHQQQLTHLQIQELQRQQFYQFHYHPVSPPQNQNQQENFHYHHQHYLFHRNSDPTILPPDLPPPSSLSRRQRLSSISQNLLDERASQSDRDSTNREVALITAGAQHQCVHPFHKGQRAEDFEEVFHHQVVFPQIHHHGDTEPIDMTLNHSMNNLSAHHQENLPSGGGSSSSTSKNIMPSSTSIPVSSGTSSAKTTATSIPSSASHMAGRDGHVTPSSISSGVGDSVQSSRENFSSSSSTSSSSSSSEDVSSGSTFVTGFDSSDSRGSSVPSSLNKPPHPNIMNNMENSSNKNSNSNNVNSNHHHRSSTLNNPKSYGDSTAQSSGYPSLPYMPAGYRKPGVCPSCNGLVPTTTSSTNHHLVPVMDLSAAAAAGGGGGPLDIIGGSLHHNNPLSTNNLKSDNNNAFWNFTKFQHPLQRDHSFHSVGGFTLNGQYNTQVKKRRMVKFCSSHKIALVVSTFSLMVTIGLIITLILMKKRGMMDTMDMMPT